ncbi:MAG: right-handed parallel beta-helix repeat-containing protein, partial [Terracidiphilus sp.]
ITIDGGSHLAAISSGVSSYGIYVAAPAGSTITLRNLSIRNSAGAYYGVQATGQGYTLHIEHCMISGFWESGIFVTGGGSAVNFYLDETILQGNFDGVSLEDNVTANISNSHFLENSGCGIAGGDNGVNLAMTNSEISGSAYGFYFYNVNAPASTASIANSVVANNQYGVLANGAEVAVALSNVSLFNNTTAGYSILNGGVVTSFRNNANTGAGTPTNSTVLR